MHTKAMDVIKGYEQSLVNIILYSINELPFSFGKKKIIGILRGSKSSYVIDHELYQLDLYGILPDFKVKYLNCVLERMLDQGLLEIEMVSGFQNRPTLNATQKGKDFLEGRFSADIEFAAELSDKEVILLDDQEQALYDDLRQRRRSLALVGDVPAFVICGNISLREMAKKKPQTEAELLSINGIGKNFVDNYSDDFLGVIKLFNTPEEMLTEI